MIANCTTLVTRFSSVAYVALALGKEVHAEVPTEELKRLLPLQNGGRFRPTSRQVPEPVRVTRPSV